MADTQPSPGADPKDKSRTFTGKEEVPNQYENQKPEVQDAHKDWANVNPAKLSDAEIVPAIREVELAIESANSYDIDKVGKGAGKAEGPTPADLKTLKQAKHALEIERDRRRGAGKSL